MMKRKLLFAGMAAMLFGGGALAADTASLQAAGNRALQAQEISETEQALRLAVEQSSDAAALSVANARLAAFLMSDNRNREAIDAYQSAIIASPQQAGLFVGIAIAYLHEGSYSSAQAMAAQALALDPDLDGARKLTLYIDKKQQQLDADALAAHASAVSKAGASGHALPTGHPMTK